MNKFKLIVCTVAALLLSGSYAEDTDCGALITTSNIEGTAKVQNLTGADAGKATITINNNSGTANSVTVYNAATVDSALSGKASTGDVTALQNRATALETATNNLTSAVGSALADAKAYTDEQCGAIQDGLTPTLFNITTSIKDVATSATNYTDACVSNCLPLAGGSLTGDFHIRKQNATYSNYGTYIYINNGDATNYIYFPGSLNEPSGLLGKDKLLYNNSYDIFATRSWVDYWLSIKQWSYTAITNAPWVTTETDPTVPSWAKASSKPSYNFSEIGSKPTTISGYGITDAKIANGVITLGANTITPVTTETDPIWASEKSGYVPTSRKVAGMALSSDITLKNLSIVGSSTTTYNGSGTASVNQTTQTQTSTTQNGTTGKNLSIQVAATSLDMGAYYIKIGTDGKPHLMLRQ